jgi:hypothetical protein
MALGEEDVINQKYFIKFRCIEMGDPAWTLVIFKNMTIIMNTKNVNGGDRPSPSNPNPKGLNLQNHTYMVYKY